MIAYKLRRFTILRQGQCDRPGRESIVDESKRVGRVKEQCIATDDLNIVLNERLYVLGIFKMSLYLYISSCIYKAQKVLTLSFHPLRFAAKALTHVHDCHQTTILLSSAILLHVVFGRPCLLLPSGLHSNAVTQCSSLFFLIICPIQFHLRRLISSLALFTAVITFLYHLYVSPN